MKSDYWHLYTRFSTTTLTALLVASLQTVVAYAQPSHKEAHPDTPAAARDVHVAALVKLINDRSVQGDVSNLKHVALHVGSTGQPIHVALDRRTPAVSCKLLEKRLRSLAFAPTPAVHSRRINVTLVDLPAPKTK